MMVDIETVRTMFRTTAELGLYTEPLLNVGWDNELMAEYWHEDKYLSIDIKGSSIDISGTYKGVFTFNCIEKGWLYE